jgi:hypothetical protein
MDTHIHTTNPNPTQHTHLHIPQHPHLQLHIHLLTGGGGGPLPPSNSAFLRGIRARAAKTRELEAQRLVGKREKARGKLEEKGRKLEEKGRKLEEKGREVEEKWRKVKWKARAQSARLELRGRGMAVGLGQFGGFVGMGPWRAPVRRGPVTVSAPAGGTGSVVQGERGVVREGEQEARQGG